MRVLIPELQICQTLRDSLFSGVFTLIPFISILLEDPQVIRRILAHLDDNASPVPTAVPPECRAPPLAVMLEGFKANPSHIIAASTHAAGLLGACRKIQPANALNLRISQLWRADVAGI